ncbi:hypothetical protein T440DRAFT_77353 [Plenodomus tracheiphilus IPT5]|uniref:Uncharacterized protein n=1 Tax=Plenodomus tracheiphilus IPT5 TaxID=1408161 RepID=A0A6A7B6B9_9PLEO|nr:hypothetical protein T440DRAFT_77353 [Plenodomus tracheiphilus IPT5]
MMLALPLRTRGALVRSLRDRLNRALRAACSRNLQLATLQSPPTSSRPRRRPQCELAMGGVSGSGGCWALLAKTAQHHRTRAMRRLARTESTQQHGLHRRRSTDVTSARRHARSSGSPSFLACSTARIELSRSTICSRLWLGVKGTGARVRLHWLVHHTHPVLLMHYWRLGRRASSRLPTPTPILNPPSTVAIDWLHWQPARNRASMTLLIPSRRLCGL